MPDLNKVLFGEKLVCEIGKKILFHAPRIDRECFLMGDYLSFNKISHVDIQVFHVNFDSFDIL